MGRDAQHIVSVSITDTIRIHFLSCIYGLWILITKLVKYLWNSKASVVAPLRGNPPLCLVDNSLGQHKYVKIQGVKFHYVEAGDKTRPMILLLHGFPDFWIGWRHQIPVLAENYRVVALDLKGFGDSDKPERRRCYKIDVILEELRQFIVTLGVNNCIVVGHDLGGLLGWYLINHVPSMVERFFAVSCPHPNIYWDTSSNHWLNYVQLPFLPEIDALKQDVRIITEYHKDLQYSPTYLQVYKYAFSRTEDWTGPINYYRNLTFNKIAQNLGGTIEVPVVLITGNKDPLIKLEGVVTSTDYCDKFHMKIVDGAGHFPHQDQPEIFNKILLQFLNKSNVDSKTPSKRLMDRMFGAVSSTVKYGNSVIDTVNKRTNSSIGLLNYSYLNSDRTKL